MRPVAVLNAILFGSAAAITFGLLGVLAIFLILEGRHPQMREELPTLWRSGLLFASFAAISGLSLYGVLKELRWRWAAQVAMWLWLAGIATFYVRA